jgi:hypothetical protein
MKAWCALLFGTRRLASMHAFLCEFDEKSQKHFEAFSARKRDAT